MNNNVKYEVENVKKKYKGIKKLMISFTGKLFSPFIRFQNSLNEYFQETIEGQRLDFGKKLVEQKESFDNQLIKQKESFDNQLMEQKKNFDNQLAEQRKRFSVKFIEQQDIHQKQMADYTEQLEYLEKHLKKMKCDLGAVARQSMLVKWKEIDNHLGEVEKADDILECNICGFSQKRVSYEIKETECVFNGGHLTRYVCPQCGVIFGPTKFLAQGQKGIDEDYWVHYLGFSEGDSSYKETRAFYMLHPTKEGIYLNYGCGHWSKSMQQLRSEGYNVYGYEPYSPDIDNPYMITSKEQLQRMRFDGIYSNDLLEHLIDPIEDLKFMSTLLFNAESKMAHCTACYIYKYEFTRFHTHFFTGDSVRVLAENSGLQIVDYCDDMEENDFICYVYTIKKEHISFLDSMKIKNDGAKGDNGILLDENGIVYGPYLYLTPRAYKIHIIIEGNVTNAEICVNANCGADVFFQGKLQTGDNLIEFHLTEFQSSVECVIENKGAQIKIADIYFE